MSDDEYESETGSEVSMNWDELCDVHVLYSASDDNGARDVIREWNYFRRSNENGYLNHSVLNRESFQLEYNSTDKWLLQKATTEIKHILHKAHIKLFEADNGQAINQGSAFAAVLPYQFLNIFCNWLKTGVKPASPSQTQCPSFMFGNLCVFLHCEFKMRLLAISESMLKQFNVSSDEIKQYKAV